MNWIEYAFPGIDGIGLPFSRHSNVESYALKVNEDDKVLSRVLRRHVVGLVADPAQKPLKKV